MGTDLGKGVTLRGNKIIYESPGGTVRVQKKVTGGNPIKINLKKEWEVTPGVRLGIRGQAKGKDKSIGIQGKFKFQEGSKGKTIGKTLDDLLKKTPANRNLKNARAARDSGLGKDVWSGFLTNKQKQILGIE